MPLFRKLRRYGPIPVDPPSQPLTSEHLSRTSGTFSRRFSTQTSTSVPYLGPPVFPQHATICSLPDELISIIFFYLEPSDTTGALQAPRHAFALAQTSIRFYRFFVQNLTHITPDISNDAPLTLSRSHILSVIRLAGEHLRELHLPRSSFPTLAFLPTLCPNVETLVIVEGRHRHFATSPLAKAMSLPLRSLSITNPSRASLCLFDPPPEQLYLKMFNTKHFKELDAILKTPPKKLYIHSEEINIYCLLHVLKSLIKACPSIEDFTLKIPDISTWMELPAAHHDLTDYIFLERALELFEKERRKKNSKCKNIVLEGDAVALTRLAHPEASIEITNDKQTFVNDGDVVYAKRLPLWDMYLSQDLSRLAEVAVGQDVHPQWKDVLAGIRLSRAVLEDPSEAEFLCLDVEVLETPLNKISAVDWHSFKNVREVRLMGIWETNSVEQAITFFQSMARLLNEFQGKTVWLSYLPTFWLRKKHRGLKTAVYDMEHALQRFEEEGGDAGTLKALVARINWMRVSPPVTVLFKKLFAPHRCRSMAALAYET